MDVSPGFKHVEPSRVEKDLSDLSDDEIVRILNKSSVGGELSTYTAWWYTYPSEQFRKKMSSSVGIIIPNWMEKHVQNDQPIHNI